MKRSSILLAAALLCAGVLSARAEDEGDLRPWLTASLEVYNERSADPLPFLSATQIDDLLAGEVVRIRRRDGVAREGEERPERATGYLLVQQPRLKVWLAALDPAFQATDMLTEVRLAQGEDGNSIWYQHVDLPWPITDRHWTIALDKNLELCAATEGFIWEQRWDLATDGKRIAQQALRDGGLPGLDAKTFDASIYLPVNQGAWTLFALTEDVTLVAYRVSTVVGGSIPDSWIATFAMAQLEGLLKGIAGHSETAWRNYDPSKNAVFTGDGQRIDARVSDDSGK